EAVLTPRRRAVMCPGRSGARSGALQRRPGPHHGGRTMSTRRILRATLGSILALAMPAAASAQPAEDEAPPAPPPPAKAPPAYPPPQAPPRLSFGQVSAAAATAGEAPPEGAEAPESAPPAKPTSVLDRFKGTYLDWGHAANTQLFGIGSNYIS